MKVKNPYGFIYITTNLINGKRYIGQKKFDTGSRWRSYLGSGTYLANSIKKYGKENFHRDIVDYSYSLEELNKKESEWIEFLDAVKSEDYYNMIEGGDVLGALNKRNAVKCMCIDNGKAFASIKDACQWSGYSETKIKKSFKENHTFWNYKKEDFIFRPIDDFSEKLCSICGEHLTKYRIRRGTCLPCAKNINKRLRKCEDCPKMFRARGSNHLRCKKCAEKRTQKVKVLYAKQRRKKKKENSLPN
ncbi:hypothetical protein BEH_24205 [Priestia filamentosa]|uniref:GIY-YIG domain-containing protein n=1 Tax=Priestia filamentosa TaxID=1402861 RepID=A0A2S1LZC2_9BACI|nr:GIY-YIG nuclease family protein [Priestia filamentosa]AWG44156.1 hypothetical protein BEH_24205 [Priestia filamentosa]